MRLPRSRSLRPCGEGLPGGVIEAMGPMGIILMLSSVSAPSRVPHVVCIDRQRLNPKQTKEKDEELPL